MEGLSRCGASCHLRNGTIFTAHRTIFLYSARGNIYLRRGNMYCTTVS